MIIFLLLYSNIKAQTCKPLATALPVNQNYIATYMPRVAGIANPSSATNTTCQVMANVQYFDGLGRPVQTVEVKGSPSGRDIVQPMAYDQFGRDAVKYLPYVASAATSDGSYKGTAIADQATFYNNPTVAGAPGVVLIPVVNSVTPSFAQTGFEPSPLNRPVEQSAPGAAWQFAGPGAANSAYHTVKTSYTTNNATALSDTANTMLVALYSVTINSDQSRTLTRATGTTANYGAGQLDVTMARDENWKNGRSGTTEEYKDKEGRVVLKRTFNYIAASLTLQILSTYYVYDDLGNLAFVLTPGSSPDLPTGAPSQTLLDNLCYQYDQLNRLVQRRLPGKGWEYLVYNILDQVVATQDAVQHGKATPEWTFTKYDGQGRVAYTGIWNASNVSRTTLQGQVNGFTSYWETRNPGGDYSAGNAWPNNFTTILTINYYDDYSYPGNPYTGGTGTLTKPTGLLTATKTTVLNPDGTYGQMLWAVHYYDGLGREVQTDQQHFLGGVYNTSNYDDIATSYDFTNEDTVTSRHHYTRANLSAAALTANVTYYYDNMGRKTQTWEAVFTTSPVSSVLLSQIDYNEIGQVKAKHLHSSTGAAPFLQDIAYTYNERGWLLSSSAPKFAMQLYYNTGTTPQYNGNISNQYWGTAGSLTNHYTYKYDNLNRLLSGMATTGNNEQNIAYDLMGNITTLYRYQNSAAIDKLTYTYTAGTNKLASVADVSGSDAGLVNGTTTYLFDVNGNLQSAANAANALQDKSFTYNLLNLPKTATVHTGTITYTYDAEGIKLRKVSVQNGATKTTDYISGIEYDGDGTTNTLRFIQTDEGKALPGGNDYIYYLSDNLGNTRYTISSATAIYQLDDYYPFGMDINSHLASPKNEYLYNKKELQDELVEYDYGARFYDPVIARWTSVDPLAEKSRRWSPYNYAENNPIRYIDPDGMAPQDIVWFDNQGNETNRIKSNSIFITYVQDNSYNPLSYTQVPMPNIIQERTQSKEDVTAPKYQKNDYQIAASTYLANQQLRSGNMIVADRNGNIIPKDQLGNVQNISVDIVKAWSMQESHDGVRGSILQVNNNGDFTPDKIAIGITEGATFSPNQEINLAIRYAIGKGFTSTPNYANDGKGTILSRNWTWHGWNTALKNYNGGGVKGYENYIKTMVEQSKEPQPQNY